MFFRHLATPYRRLKDGQRAKDQWGKHSEGIEKYAGVHILCFKRAFLLSFCEDRHREAPVRAFLFSVRFSCLKSFFQSLQKPLITRCFGHNPGSRSRISMTVRGNCSYPDLSKPSRTSKHLRKTNMLETTHFRTPLKTLFNHVLEAF